jgi:cytochrome b6
VSAPGLARSEHPAGAGGADGPPRGARRGPLAAAWHWLDERLDLAALVALARAKEIPLGAHSMIWYYLGGVTIFFFLVQIATGILLLFYYQAGEATSWESLRYIVTRVPFGWLVRSVHCWSAHLMVVSLLVHMWSVFFLSAYRKPRELTWLTGIALFAVTLGFGFSGYLLPWNELAFFATAVGTDSVKAVPLVGDWLLRVLRGGEEVSIRTLYRCFALHVAILPLATFAVLGVHLVLVQKQGMAPPLAEPGAPPRPRRSLPFFPNFALRDLLLWILAVNLLALLAVLLPHGPGIPGLEWEVGVKADPLKPAYPGIRPEWYFLWVYQLLKEFPPHLVGLEGPEACLALVTLVLGLWAFVPFLDRGAARGRPSPAFTDFGVALLVQLLFLTVKAWDPGVEHAPGVDPSADPASAATIAATAAHWTLGIGAAVTALRAARFGHRSFWASGAACLQVALHGYARLPYLVAGAIALAPLGGIAFVALRKRRRVAAGAAALLAALALLAPASAAARAAPAAATIAGGALPESAWPAPFRRLFDAETEGRAVVSARGRERFRALPAHAQRAFFSAVERELLDTPEQLADLLALEIADEHVETLIADNCVLCHTNRNWQAEETLFRRRDDPDDPYRHLDLAELAADVHLRRGLSCAGCHGGDPRDPEMTQAIYDRWPDAARRQADRSWVPGFCAERCHSSAAFMRAYDPALPIDQLLKYRESRHGIALVERERPGAAECVSCHGVHGIRDPTSPQSLVFPKNIPATCGRCHADPARMRGHLLDDGVTPIPTGQLEEYRRSVHGRALFDEDDLGAPACNDCHGNHAAMPPAVASVSQICRNCHVNNGKLFDGSPHKAAFERHGWPECEVCHGKHAIERPSDELLGGGAADVCASCHARFADPGCDETARHFRAGIAALERERRAALDEVARAEEAGLDLAEVRFELAAVDDALVETRTKIHAFDRSEFDKSAAQGLEIARAAQATTAAALAEHGRRRVGLAISTLVVSLVAGLLYLKIRQVDRESGLGS